MSSPLFLDVIAVGLACLGGLGLGVFGMMILFVITGNSKWQRLRRRIRPLLWNFGLDWPEIKRTWKRAFILYYARGLPDSTLQSEPPSSSDDALLDESGDVPPANSPQTSFPTATP